MIHLIKNQTDNIGDINCCIGQSTFRIKAIAWVGCPTNLIALCSTVGKWKQQKRKAKGNSNCCNWMKAETEIVRKGDYKLRRGQGDSLELIDWDWRHVHINSLWLYQSFNFRLCSGAIDWPVLGYHMHGQSHDDDWTISLSLRLFRVGWLVGYRLSGTPFAELE